MVLLLQGRGRKAGLLRGLSAAVVIVALVSLLLRTPRKLHPTALKYGARDDKVVVGFYFESLCPDCSQAMTKGHEGFFYDLMSGAYNDMFEIMTVMMVPWGNAKEGQDGTFTCQHGYKECLGNAYDLCALTLLGGNTTEAIASGASSRVAWPFIECMQETKARTPEVCAAKVPGLDHDALKDCVDTRWYEMQHAGAVLTTDLCHQPCGCHTWVPWTTINGRTSQREDSKQGPKTVEEVVTAVCSAYRGERPKPASCGRMGGDGGGVDQQMRDGDFVAPQLRRRR